MSNKDQVKFPGLYKYSLPEWRSRWVAVSVEKDSEGRLMVRFSEFHYPVNMKNIPDRAIFEPDWS